MKKISLTVLVLLTFFKIFAVETEARISLNGLWNFKADYYNKGESELWFTSAFNDTGWDKLPVPGNWDMHNEYAEFSGKGWYRTVFKTPANVEGKIVRLNFEAVGIDYKVWLNGKQIANVTGGYFSNYLDITDKIKPGAKNCLVVCADNTFRSGAYWSWGGIRRPVTLIINNPLFIQSVKILSVPDLQKKTASVSVKVNLFNGGEMTGDAVIDYELINTDKTIIKGSQKAIFKKGAVNDTNFQLSLSKNELKLWDFDSPNLYTLKVSLKKNRQVTHEVSERFGIRKLEILGGKLLLNGESVRLMGFNWVADDRLTGNTLPAEIYKRDIDDMKSLGANMTRLSHVPLPKDVLDYLDEKGMLVISEIPIWGTTKLADPDNATSKSWIRQMVNTSYNHPSIVGWSVGNEIGDKSSNPHVMEYVEKAIKFVKDSLDHSRFVVSVSNTANRQSSDISVFSDFVPYNCYNNWGKNVAKIHEYQPEKLIFLTEYGENLIGEDLNTSMGNFKKIMSEIRGKDYLFGGSLWTYNDYRSNYRSNDPTWDTKLSGNRDWGVIDAYGNKKRAHEIIRKEYSPLRQLLVKDSDNNLTVMLQPRQKLDLPAYTLHNYKLVCKEFNKENTLIRAQEIPLPVIKPGDQGFSKQFSINRSKETKIAACKIAVVNPSGYEFADTTIYYTKPSKPIIKAAFYDGSKIRVLFDHVALAVEYKLLYGQTELNMKSQNTIDNYIEVTNFNGNKIGAASPLQLVAVNGFGENFSDVQTTKMMMCNKLPPVIKAVKSFQDGISIGYSSEKGEYLYKVQYSTTKDFSSDVHIIQTTSKGACYVPNLISNTTYFVRMCAYGQYELISPWSETRSVKL